MVHARSRDDGAAVPMPRRVVVAEPRLGSRGRNRAESRRVRADGIHNDIVHDDITVLL